MGSRSWSAVVACVLALAALAVGRFTAPGRAAPEADPVPAPGAKVLAPVAGQLAGRASCSGRACHGGLEPAASGLRQDEFTTWLAHDKHARAFDVLKGERARRMAKNLGIQSAETDVRCLACHTTPQLAGPVPAELVALREDGVGCEACHGPADGGSGWLKRHTQIGWKGLSADEKKKTGMTPLSDLAVQAETCAGCHVGADDKQGVPARDLNHDLMAAGHPRLTFELSTFRDNMPPHWRADLHADTPGYEASVWAVGQVASAEASVKLLEHRASHADSPWPEFAEASCFACHADLHADPNVPSWRRNAAYYHGRRIGAIPYNRWNNVLLPALGGVAREQTVAVEAAFEKIADEMNKPYPDRKKVADLARTARSDLGALLAAIKPVQWNQGAVRAVAGGLAGRLEGVAAPDWDEMTQAALAAAALRDAAGAGRMPAGPLDDLFFGLRFRAPYESPEGYSPRDKSDGQNEDLRARLIKVLQGLAR